MKIIFTSDTHGNLYPYSYALNKPEQIGLFSVASLIEKDGDTLVMDGGDSLQGTPLMSYYLEHKNEYDFHPMAEGFKAMGLDYYTLGNHDFNFGYDAIADYVSAMEAVLVSANVEDKTGGLDIKKNVIKTMPDGTRVGITAAVTGYVNVWEQKSNLENFIVSDPVEALIQQYNELKDNCDITIAIYHGGFEENLTTGVLLSETAENQACKISRELGFDILLTGHQHIAVEGAWIEGTYGVQPPAKAAKFCELNVKLTEKGLDISSKLIDAKAKEDKFNKILDDHAFMNELSQKVEKWLDQPIGCLEKEIAPEEKLDAALHGSKVAAIFNQVQLDYTGADFSCTSLSNDPLGLKKDITVRDVLGIYQFANTVEVKEVTRETIKIALERCAEYFDYNEETKEVKVADCFLAPKIEHYNYDYYGNLDYAFDISRPVGDRVIRLRKLDGTELEEGKIYTLVTSNYRATGTGGYDCIGKSKVHKSYSDEMPDLLISFIRKNTPVKEITNSKLSVYAGEKLL